MAQILSQCSVTITPIDEDLSTIDIANGFAKDLTAVVNQKNQMFRGVMSVNQAGDVAKINLDQENTLEINTLFVPEPDLVILETMFNDAKLCNISIVYNSGQNAGRKYLLTNWTLNSFPHQSTIDGTPDKMTLLSFSGFLFEGISAV